MPSTRSSPVDPEPRHTVIVGAGIVGAATAYYLAHHPLFNPASHKITLLESSSVAAGASGKSGGFLAQNWHSSSTASLGALSFGLHEDLAREHGGEGRWGYRKVDTLSVQGDLTAVRGLGEKKKPSSSASSSEAAVRSWLADDLVENMVVSSLGSTSTTAQVTPALFTEALLEETPSVQIVKASPTELVHSPSSGRLRAVRYSGKGIVNGQSGVLEGVTEFVFANGPWVGGLAKGLLGEEVGGRLDVSGEKANSIVVRLGEEGRRRVGAHALFTHLTFPDSSTSDPEVYPRPDGSVYLCGSTSSDPLPTLASDVEPDEEAVEALVYQAGYVSPFLRDGGEEGGEVERRQACFLPSAERGRPLVGKVRGVEDVWVGAGLSCWGITLGPGTGKLLAEGILDGRMYSADVRRLAP